MKKPERSAIRVEQHPIDTRHASYALLASFCHKAKNLYNHANYLVRHTFFKEKQWLRYGTLDKVLKEDKRIESFKVDFMNPGCTLVIIKENVDE